MNPINEAYWRGWHNGYNCAKDDYHFALVNYLASNPDTVEVVRCKDCKHNQLPPTSGNADCELWYGMTSLYGYCHCGERRKDADSN